MSNRTWQVVHSVEMMIEAFDWLIYWAYISCCIFTHALKIVQWVYKSDMFIQKYWHLWGPCCRNKNLESIHADYAPYICVYVFTCSERLIDLYSLIAQMTLLARKSADSAIMCLKTLLFVLLSLNKPFPRYDDIVQCQHFLSCYSMWKSYSLSNSPEPYYCGVILGVWISFIKDCYRFQFIQIITFKQILVG